MGKGFQVPWERRQWVAYPLQGERNTFILLLSAFQWNGKTHTLSPP